MISFYDKTSDFAAAKVFRAYVTRDFWRRVAPFTKNSGNLVIDEMTRETFSGMHYFRIPYQYWENRIYAAKTAGMNTIQTYVAWNQHEPSPGVYNFEGNLDIVNFIKEVGRQDMNLILRVGPYICAEWNFGGLPPWLLAIPGMQVRSQNEDFLFAVTRWFKEFFPRVRPYLYSNGGPIIMVQVCESKLKLNVNNLLYNLGCFEKLFLF